MSEPTPRWTRAVTRPTRAEVDALVPHLDPAVVAFARDATRPTPGEVSALRPRPRRSMGALVPAALTVVAAALVFVWSEPELLGGRPLEGRVVQDEAAGVYVVSPDQDLLVRGVEVRGTGTVQERGGVLAVAGQLDLVVHDPVVIAVDGREYRVRDALVHVDRSVVVVEPFPVAVVVAEPVPELPPLPPTPVALRVAPVPVAPEPPPVPVDPADPAEAAWREVLGALESRQGSTDVRARLLRSFAETWSDSRFAPEAGALAVLVPGVDGPPEQRLDELEAWLKANPGGPRAVEVEALAARVARERLTDCGRARPHDEAVAARGTATAREKAKAFLGLCARAEGRNEDGNRWLGAVDPSALDPALRTAVQHAREEGP